MSAFEKNMDSMVALEIARQMTDNFNEEKRVAEVVLSLFSKIAQEV